MWPSRSFKKIQNSLLAQPDTLVIVVYTLIWSRQEYIYFDLFFFEKGGLPELYIRMMHTATYILICGG